MTMRDFRAAALVLALSAAASGSAAELIRDEPFIPTTRGESGVAGVQLLGTDGWLSWSAAAPVVNRVEVIADRVEYVADDLNGQFLVLFMGPVRPEGEPAYKIRLSLKDAAGQEMGSKTVSPVKSPKLPVLVAVSELQPGKYTLSATLQDKDGKPLQQTATTFTRSARQDPHIAFPREGVAINVHPQSFVPDGSWPISTGVPMPIAALKGIDGLQLLENGARVPAQFSTRGLWSPEGYVKWVGVDFVAKYDGGKPREYRLVHDPMKHLEPGRPLTVQESAERIVVDTGAIKFQIGRKPFAGLEKVWVRGEGEAAGAYADKDLVVDGAGGPFIVDEKGTRFDSQHAKDVSVAVEESGPVSALIAAKGWYYSESGGKLCQFVIRFQAFAGQPYVTLSHRMINTIREENSTEKLADVGFETLPAGRLEKWRYGADGKSQGGDAGAQPASIYLHQDRSDHFRLMKDETPIAEGKRSDGWMNATTAGGSISYFLRNIYQRYPKELEFNLGATQSKLVAHFWPKHGHVVYTEDEELARDQIHKVRFAEQGKLLDMVLPEKYTKKADEYLKNENGYGTRLTSATGQGTVIGNDLVIWFAPKPEAESDLAARAGLIQLSPHALPDPAWNCATGAYGPMAPRDPVKFPTVEKLFDNAYAFYLHGIIEAGDNYGLWTYGGVPETWRPDKNAPHMNRPWQRSHYQGVYNAWLRYFRSGLPEHFEWARIASNQQYDVGVVNYRLYPPAKDGLGDLGDIGGTLLHWGDLPWGGADRFGERTMSANMGHWMDISNYFARYFMTGDRRGPDLAELWMHTLGVMETPNRVVVPTSPDAYRNDEKMKEINQYRKDHPEVKLDALPKWMQDERAKPTYYNTREVLVPLGEFASYYEATWNPQALIYLDDFAQYMNLPFEITGSADLSTFGAHWQDWYYELTRDPRTVARVREYSEFLSKTWQRPTSASFAAFLYHSTGEKTWLEPLITPVYDQTLVIYTCPGDRFDGFCAANSAPMESNLFGPLPYFIHAVDAAGLKFEHADSSTTMVPSRGGRLDKEDQWLDAPRGWSDAGLTVLARASKPTKLAILLKASARNMYVYYQLHSGFPELNIFAQPGLDVKKFREAQTASLVTLEQKPADKAAPTGRRLHQGSEEPHTFPFTDHPANDPANLEYRLELDGDPYYLPIFLAADTGRPLPQVAVVARTLHRDNKVTEVPSRYKNVINAWFRPLDDRSVVTLKLTATNKAYQEPTTMRITDARGSVIVDTSVFFYGLRKSLEVTLDPAKNPLPWLMLSASEGDNELRFTGADELFFARDKADLDEILPRIPVYRKPATEGR